MSSRLHLSRQNSAKTVRHRPLYLRLNSLHSALASTQVSRFLLPRSHIRSQWSPRRLWIQKCRFTLRMLPRRKSRHFRRHHLPHHQTQRHLNSIVMPEDSKVFVIAGCKVTLHFRLSTGGRWMVEGSVSSGEQDHKRTTTFAIDSATSRDAAESLALKKAGELLGNYSPIVDQQYPGTSTPYVPPGIQ